MATTKYRYTGKIHEKEKDYNRNVREMLEMIKNEEVRKGEIDYKNLQMTRHATERVIEHLECNEGKALKKVQWMLKRSTRVGDQLAFDGRINVMFVFNQYAIYLSPNLENVVTFHKVDRVTYNPIKRALPKLQKQYSEDELKDKLISMHREAWDDIEQKEIEQTQILLDVENEVSKSIDKLASLLNDNSYKPKHYAKYLRQRINEERYKIKVEGHRLFQLKLEKRHVGKSMASLL